MKVAIAYITCKVNMKPCMYAAPISCSYCQQLAMELLTPFDLIWPLFKKMGKREREMRRNIGHEKTPLDMRPPGKNFSPRRKNAFLNAKISFAFGSG